MGDRAKLTLGPLLFDWPPEEKRDFYLRIAEEAPVDVVYLGEVVCSKRWPFFAPYLPELVERLRGAGKEVVLSTLALIMSERELETVREIADESACLVEGNDISTLARLAGRPHVVGPFVNVYNEGTLGYLTGEGASRVVLSCELARTALGALAGAASAAELEVQVFGRVPLAISARCYHARAHRLPKSACQFVCAEDRDGLALETLGGGGFLAVNGTQTLSHTVVNLAGEIAELRGLGIGCFRLWPHDVDMVGVARIFRNVLDGHEDGLAARARLGELVDLAPFSNGFFHGREGAVLVADDEEPRAHAGAPG
jgi:collagenase-like PrtC family protease